MPRKAMVALTRIMPAAGLCLAAAGCVSQAELVERDRSTCAAIGYARDTPEFRNCVLQLESARIRGWYAAPIFLH